MFRKSFPTRTACATFICLIAAAVAVPAQSNDQKKAPGKLTAAMVKTGLYMISGGGCNSLVRLSASGLIVVDGKLPGNYAALSQLAKSVSFSEQPIRILINTDYQQHHTGNNAKFLEAGAAIVAHERVIQEVANYNPPGGKITPPTRTYDHRFTIRLGGVEVQLFHFGNAHTSGDTVAYFPDLKVVAVGDLFAASPEPDLAAGGSLAGWGQVLSEILKLDFDVVVPGNGQTVTRADIQALRTEIDSLVSRAKREGSGNQSDPLR
jgi:cyclase